MLKIRVMNISKAELSKTLKKFKGTAWDQSPIFKKLYEQEFGLFGGEPYGCLVSDYYFDHSPPDVELLGEIAQISAAAHALFIAGAGPTVMQMDSWQELSNPVTLPRYSLPRNTPPGARCVKRRTHATSVWSCRGFWRACPMGRRLSPSMNLISKRMSRARGTINIPGPTRRMRWRSISIVPSSCMAGVRASAAWSPAGRSRACRPTPFPPMTVAST